MTHARPRRSRPPWSPILPPWSALVARVAGEAYYGFDTEFHTERTYVPQLALIQIAWGDKVALVDPLAVDPAPLAELFGGPVRRWPMPPCRTSTS